jgi:hypothetical protein
MKPLISAIGRCALWYQPGGMVIAFDIDFTGGMVIAFDIDFSKFFASLILGWLIN